MDVLVAFLDASRPVDVLLEKAIGSLPDPRDVALAHVIVTGVLQQKGYLQQILSGFLRKPLPQSQHIVQAALLAGLYQILFLDRIPAPIAIHETVNTLKGRGQSAPLTGLVNAVLRNVLRARDKGDWQPETGMVDEARLSHPAWLLDRWRARYGQETMETICRSNNSQPLLVLRVNTRVASRQALGEQFARHEIVVEEGRFAPEALRLVGFRGSPATLPGYQEGLFQVQDEGAQLISHLLGPFGEEAPMHTYGEGLANRTFLDACAGLGGKTSHLATLLADGCHLVAVEPTASRQRLFGENFARLGLPQPEFFQGTLEQYAAQDTTGGCAGILIDAPCSGLGVVGRHPEIRWLRQEADLAGYQEKQLSLLETAASLLAPGGVLVYATCSTEPEENEAVIHRFCAGHADFVIQPVTAILPPAAHSLADADGFFRALPGLSGMDGFFAARMIRQPLPQCFT